MIRRAKCSDLHVICNLLEELEQTSFPPAALAPILEEMLGNPPHVIFLAENETGVVGMLHLRMEMQLHHAEKIAEILELAVTEKQRSGGIGRQLLDAAKEEAKANHCTQIEVTSHQKRQRAHAFYQREGMRHTHLKLTMPFE